ncbi:ENHANCER OF AG-4 protein 2-like isoform X2 [Penaeus japonicus]|uniref:ENHANCER OF AG-4 protein 2-like isoform X2 n=1 Tax=Penaeus japonicus TaxID=27405 RepID=UPI001C71500D|nr:ENHANCER OF AG-4 protein 2-like isoform X2 [Penaeus japonicus]
MNVYSSVYSAPAYDGDIPVFSSETLIYLSVIASLCIFSLIFSWIVFSRIATLNGVEQHGDIEDESDYADEEEALYDDIQAEPRPPMPPPRPPMPPPRPPMPPPRPPMPPPRLPMPPSRPPSRHLEVLLFWNRRSTVPLDPLSTAASVHESRFTFDLP